MPSTRRIIPWTSKPPVGYGVNWSNPLANGLLAFFPCNEGGGAPADLCQGLALTNNTTAGTWGQDAHGTVYGTNATAAGAQATCPAYLQIQPPITVVWSGNILGTPSNGIFPFGISYNSAHSTPFSGVEFQVLSTLVYRFQFSWNTGAGNYTYMSSSAQSVGPIWIAGTITSSAQSLYVNNPFVANATLSQAITTIAYSGTSLIYLGASTFNSGNTAACSHSYYLIYNRILSNAELNQLYTYGPWGMIAPAQGTWLKQAPKVYLFGAMRRNIPRTQKPPVGPGVNWSNPLAQGLLAFFACNEGGGAPVDLCYGLALTKNSTAPGTWGQNANGAVYNTIVNGAGATVTTPGYLQIQPPLTIVWSGNWLGTSGTNSFLFGTTYTNAGTSPTNGYNLSYYLSNKFILNFSSAIGTNSNVIGTAVTAGPMFIAGTVNASAQAIYVNNPWTPQSTNSVAITAIQYVPGSSELCVGATTYASGSTCDCSHSYGLIYNRILTNTELNQLYTFGPWGMIALAQARSQQVVSPYTFTASGLAISGAYGGEGATLFAPLGGLAISGAYGGEGATLFAPLGGLAISGAYGGAAFPGITSGAAGLAISGALGISTAGPSPGAAGMAISGSPGGAAETISVLLAGLGIGGALGGATGAAYVGPFYLPYEYTSVVIETANANPFGIDPEATTVITTGLTSSD